MNPGTHRECRNPIVNPGTYHEPSHLPTTFDRLPTTFEHLLTTFARLPTTFRPPSTTFRPPSDHLPTAFLRVEDAFAQKFEVQISSF